MLAQRIEQRHARVDGQCPALPLTVKETGINAAAPAAGAGRAASRAAASRGAAWAKFAAVTAAALPTTTTRREMPCR